MDTTPTLEVLVATMHQTDHRILEQMNIQSDAVVVNQCDWTGYTEFSYQGHRVVWVDTIQRGLSKSRNMALSYARGDICLIADDDIRYEDGYDGMVLAAFEKRPSAAIIAFNTHIVNNGVVSERKRLSKDRKAPSYCYYGSVRMAFRRAKIQKAGLHFNDIMGTGARYYMGEESIFIHDCRKKHLPIFEAPASIAYVDYTTTTWFDGFNEDYYFSKGAFLAANYGRMAWFFILYFLLQGVRISKLPCSAIGKSMLAGMREYWAI